MASYTRTKGYCVLWEGSQQKGWREDPEQGPGCLASRVVLMEFRAKAQEELGEGFQVQEEVEQNVHGVRRGLGEHGRTWRDKGTEAFQTGSAGAKGETRSSLQGKVISQARTCMGPRGGAERAGAVFFLVSSNASVTAGEGTSFFGKKSPCLPVPPHDILVQQLPS